MKVPRLNRPLLLERPARLPDGAGGFVESWEALGTLWAEVRPERGREGVRGAAPVSSVGQRITVRGAPVGAAERPLPEQRFRDGTRVYRILAVAEGDPSGRYLTCFATEEVVA